MDYHYLIPRSWCTKIDDDCDDSKASVSPSAVETCDSLDNDCDGLIDQEDSDLDASA